jgi:hypothetical protein
MTGLMYYVALEKGVTLNYILSQAINPLPHRNNDID